MSHISNNCFDRTIWKIWGNPAIAISIILQRFSPHIALKMSKSLTREVKINKQDIDYIILQVFKRMSVSTTPRSKRNTTIAAHNESIRILIENILAEHKRNEKSRNFWNFCTGLAFRTVCVVVIGILNNKQTFCGNHIYNKMFNFSFWNRKMYWRLNKWLFQ